MLVGMFVVSVAGFNAVAATGNIYQLAYSRLARSVALVGGCLLAVKPLETRGGCVAGWTLYLATIMLCPLLVPGIVLFTPFGIAGAMLLVANAHRSRVLRSGLLMWFGSISYSLYLWHPPLLWLLPNSRLLAVAIAIAVAAASTRWLEQPLRRHGLRAFTALRAAPASP